MPTSLDALIRLAPLRRLLTRIFIDSSFWYRHWHCHRLPARSYSLGGRQFHVCARCTGLAVGIVLSPLAFMFPRHHPAPFATVLGVLVIDGVSQGLRLRESNNLLRFFTGLLAPLSFFGMLLSL
ncbi:DUF2085 domain-containing protein [Vulcanococcus limneticus]|uniref:DUF2085 domain-containing protein n=1 Tax=Vulcanococcus limneticus TaxID=2170428 RepID=UPI00398BF598